MAGRTPTPQTPPPGDPATQSGSGPDPCPAPPTQGGTPLSAGRAFVQTVRHFFPDFNAWLDRLPDTRVQEACIYPTRFLGWWGLLLYVLQLGARRQLDLQLHTDGSQVLPNLNRSADTDLPTRPVHDTLDHFLGHTALSGWERLRRPCVQRLRRMKVLDAARLLGRPVLWREYEALRAQCPDNVLRREWAEGRQQEFRWVSALDYQDSEARRFGLQALGCTETTTESTHYFAWLTAMPVGRKTVEEIAAKGGRARWQIENEGFNRQKNSGLNLEHVDSTDEGKWKVYSVLLPIAFLIVQLLGRGSLLKRWAAELGQRVWQRFGSLKNLAQRLLESLRYLEWSSAWFDAATAERIRITFDTS